MKRWILATSAAGLAALGGVGAVQMLPASMAACMRKGYPVSVTVVGRDTVTIVQLRGDGTTGATVETSRGKAYAAVGFQSPTSGLQAGAATNPGLLTVPNFVILPGGLPIKGAGTVVAGIGVGGAPSGTIDEQCAAAGIAAIS